MSLGIQKKAGLDIDFGDGQLVLAVVLIVSFFAGQDFPSAPRLENW